jgi:formyltetrahydrofolate synthetase
MLSDLQIAQRAKMLPIHDIAERLGVVDDELEPYGKYKAKIDLSVLGRLKDEPAGKLILVTAITPTPLGEGKTVTTLGLGMGLRHIGKKAVTTIREPSMGPTFGIKGGAAGGGYAQVVPMEDLNLHFTGDIHAVGTANNLLAAMIDASVHHKNPLKIDPSSISWRRVVDLNERFLRNIIGGLGTKADGPPRQTGFDITVASEVMAILALTTSLQDLRERLGRIWIGFNDKGEPVTAEDLKAAGTMAVLLQDAIKPNLMQALDHGPCLVHAGPFANIAIGTNSILADQVALKLADYVVTEAGFGADCGAEKFLNIKCRVGDMKPHAVVIVTTIKALKMHGGAFKFPPGKTPPKEQIEKPNLKAVEIGAQNMVKHIENMAKMGLPSIIAINRFPYDSPEEVKLVQKIALAAGAEAAPESFVHADGGEGGVELAEAVVAACDKPNKFKFLYPLDWPIKKKIETIATEIYGADGVDYSAEAEKKIGQFEEGGLGNLPICMAKTHLSLSHDPTLKGRPTGFTVPIRDIRPSVGAGFLYPLCGEMRTMPGLPSKPAAMGVDITKSGKTKGLF